MKRFVLISFLIVLISGCEQVSNERNYAGGKKNGMAPIINNDNSQMLNQDKKPDIEAELNTFATDKDQTAVGKTGRERDNANKDAKEIINEIEKIICEGDCSRYTAL